MRAHRRNLLAAAIVGVGLTAVLAACSRQNLPPTATPPRMGLYYNDQGEMAALAYGAPNSDDVALMFQCAKGSGRVEVTDVAPREASPRLILASSGDSAALAAERISADGPELLVAHTDLGSAALQAFRRSGRIHVGYGDVSYSLTASHAERRGVERFFRECAARA